MTVGSLEDYTHCWLILIVTDSVCRAPYGLLVADLAKRNLSRRHCVHGKLSISGKEENSRSPNGVKSADLTVDLLA